MKLNLEYNLHDIYGVEMKDDKGASLPLKRYVIDALLTPYQDEQNLPGEDKIKRYELAKAVSQPGEVEMKVEDVALVKKLTGKLFTPLVIGQIWPLLDPKKD